jgi:hypothetical protein
MDQSYDFPKSTFYKAMITGFFVGFFATVVCLIYNITYRGITGFPLSSLINVSSIIFLVNLLFPVIGIVYYGFLTAFKKADIAFTGVFAIVTALSVWGAEVAHRTDDHLINGEFRTLLLGIVLILGVSTLIIPLLFRNKTFQEAVL